MRIESEGGTTNHDKRNVITRLEHAQNLFDLYWKIVTEKNITANIIGF